MELKVNKALTAVSLFEHDVIKKIAQAHNKSAGEVLLRWATQRGLAIIPKSSKPERLTSNLHINSFDLTQEDLETISSLDLGLRFNDPWDWDKIPIFA